jgi:hypothetical protein
MINKVFWLLKSFLAKHIIVIERASDDLKKKRLEVCLNCEFKREREGMDICAACGCFLDLKASSLININYREKRLEITHCPVGKWNDGWILQQYS